MITNNMPVSKLLMLRQILDLDLWNIFNSILMISFPIILIFLLDVYLIVLIFIPLSFFLKISSTLVAIQLINYSPFLLFNLIFITIIILLLLFFCSYHWESFSFFQLVSLVSKMSINSSLYWKDKYRRASVQARVHVIDPLLISCPLTLTGRIDWGRLCKPIKCEY